MPQLSRVPAGTELATTASPQVPGGFGFMGERSGLAAIGGELRPSTAGPSSAQRPGAVAVKRFVSSSPMSEPMYISLEGMPTGYTFEYGVHVPVLVSARVAADVAAAFRAGATESFESGMTSLLATRLDAAMSRELSGAVLEIVAFIHHPTTSEDAAAEAVRTLSQRTVAGANRDLIRRLVEGALTHRSHYVRDGGVTGLMGMADPASKPALKTAIRSEPLAQLRQDLEQAIGELGAG